MVCGLAPKNLRHYFIPSCDCISLAVFLSCCVTRWFPASPPVLLNNEIHKPDCTVASRPASLSHRCRFHLCHPALDCQTPLYQQPPLYQLTLLPITLILAQVWPGGNTGCGGTMLDIVLFSLPLERLQFQKQDWLLFGFYSFCLYFNFFSNPYS